MCLQGYLLDDGMLRLPNINNLVSNHFASLQDDLLSRIPIRHKSFSSITCWVRWNFLLYKLSKLQVLIDFSIHLQASLIGGIRKNICNLNGVLGCNNIAFLCCTQAPLFLLTELPKAIAHLLVKFEGLSEVAPQESQTDLVICLKSRSLYLRFLLSFLVFNKLFARLGLRDSSVCKLL